MEVEEIITYMKQKIPQDVLGYQIRCPNYIKCPLCYGCRNYNPSYLKCAKCNQNRKKNICDTNKHKENLIAKMITRETINL